MTGILIKHGNPPLLVAGDIFHKWNSPPEVINRFIRYFPHCYAVAGNHDLPYHNYEDIRKSAYWTLVQAGKVTNVKAGQEIRLDGLRVTGWPYGSEPVDCGTSYSSTPRVALIHDYCWRTGHTHPGAPEDKNYFQWIQRLAHYTGLIFGDNHQAFTEILKSGTWVRNGGCFIRQSTGELDVRPSVGLIHEDGSLTTEYLDTTGDQVNLDAEPQEDLEGFGEVVEELLNLERTEVDFDAAVRRAVRHVRPRVRRLVLQYMGEDNDHA